MVSKSIVFRMLLLLALFLSTAVLQVGFSIMHYKVFVKALDNPLFEKELQRWGLQKPDVRAMLLARGKDYILLMRCGVVGVSMSILALDGVAGVLLVPVWILMIAGIVAVSIVGNWKACVLYAGVLLEKCDVAPHVPLGLADTGKDLTKRLARLPSALPYEATEADSAALNRLLSGVGVCLLIWVLFRTLLRTRARSASADGKAKTE